MDFTILRFHDSINKFLSTGTTQAPPKAIEEWKNQQTNQQWVVMVTIPLVKTADVILPLT